MAPLATPPERAPTRSLLLVAFGLLVAFFAITHVLTMNQLRDARHESESVVRNMFSSIELVSQMARDIGRQRLLADTHVFERDSGSMSHVEGDITALRADYAATARTYEPLATLPGEVATWQKVKDDVASLDG